MQPGQKVKTTSRFGKSDCFVLSVNETTGKYTRNQFFSNTDVPYFYAPPWFSNW